MCPCFVWRSIDLVSLAPFRVIQARLGAEEAARPLSQENTLETKSEEKELATQVIAMAAELEDKDRQLRQQVTHILTHILTWVVLTWVVRAMFYMV